MEPFEPPKYIASLIAAINDGAKSAQLGALAFTAIGLFLLATAFSATDEDLLLNHAIAISQLGGAQVPVGLSFGLAPGVFLAAHLYTLIRYDMLAGNVRRLLVDLPAMVRREADRERCRQLLTNVEFVQALVTPKGSRSASWMFGLTVRALLAAFPVMVLLLVQLQSLRLQNEVVTWINHICIAADLILLFWFFNRLRGDESAVSGPERRRHAVAPGWLPALILAADLLWLQVPASESRTVGKTIADYRAAYPASFLARAGWLADFQPVDLVLCHPGAWGCRFLSVTHRTLVRKVWDTKMFAELCAGADADALHLASFERIVLPGRTLRFADLTASELYAADLTGADLRHATLDEAQLRGATLTRAKLQLARSIHAHLEYALVDDAHLEGATMRLVHLEGADFNNSHLEGASLSGGFMRGANFTGAYFTGASLIAAHLEGSALRFTNFEVANLAFARLEGAVLTNARLYGTTLGQASWGSGDPDADFFFFRRRDSGIDFGTHLEAADMSFANIWNLGGVAHVEIGLASLRSPEVAEPSFPASPAKAPVDMPEEVTQKLAELYASAKSRTSAGSFGTVLTSAGPVLISKICTGAGFHGIPCDRTTADEVTYLRAATAIWADKVAPTHPAAAEIVAGRVNEYLPSDDPRWPVYRDFACRLIAQTKDNTIQLKPETIQRLRIFANTPCQSAVKPPATPPPASTATPPEQTPAIPP